MKKLAQFDPNDPYSQNEYAGFGQSGYTPNMDAMQFLPGVPATTPPPKQKPGPLSGWGLPVGIAATGLLGYSLLRHMRGKGLSAAAAKLTKAEEPITWATESLGHAENSPLWRGQVPGVNAGRIAEDFAKHPEIARSKSVTGYFVDPERATRAARVAQTAHMPPNVHI